MKVYGTNFSVELKGDNSPLTLADEKANEVINSYLLKTGIPIISEENRQTDYKDRKNWTQCWIVDPLDGTKEFVKRNGEFTVNIALVINGSPHLGVIYVPVEKTLYFTSEDAKSSYKCVIQNPEASVDEIIKEAEMIRPLSEVVPPIKVVGSRSHLNDDTRAFIAEIEKEKEVEIAPEKTKKRSILPDLSDTSMDELRSMLKEAVSNEDYERASEIRDEINRRLK